MAQPGEGVLECRQIGGRIRQVCNFAYPLRLINPHFSPLQSTYPARLDEDSQQQELADSDNKVNQKFTYYPSGNFMLTYGGGLVHGDHIRLSVKVGYKVALLMLTQGTTKVFPKRNGRQPSTLISNTTNLNPNQTYQTIVCSVAPSALLCILPDPVTCFQKAHYHQRQSVHLEDPDTSSLILLDWFTSGRMSRGEHWDFDVYSSMNVVTTASKSGSETKDTKESRSLIVRDALLLDSKNMLSFKTQLSSYNVIGYLLVLGPGVAVVADVFRNIHEVQKIRPFNPALKTHVGHDPNSDDAKVTWSVSEVSESGVVGIAVRFTGPSADLLKRWLKKHLSPLRSIIGDSAFDVFYYN
ncbi:hypothetical protein H4219_003607 [Mycoemilia scoparia]|uniref:Urease accessory protein D n=1 Tax=Mycoemilia scoparia TaxID=417184 RepID=A0A9W7ZYC9_9FUNG|nr:hypothetical protein H4219_003607 [Mycoemilia scoparia]